MEIVGKIIGYARCTNCDEELTQTEWGDGTIDWAHMGSTRTKYCPNSPVASPSVQVTPAHCGRKMVWRNGKWYCVRILCEAFE